MAGTFILILFLIIFIVYAITASLLKASSDYIKVFICIFLLGLLMYYWGGCIIVIALLLLLFKIIKSKKQKTGKRGFQQNFSWQLKRWWITTGRRKMWIIKRRW